MHCEPFLHGRQEKYTLLWAGGVLSKGLVEGILSRRVPNCFNRSKVCWSTTTPPETQSGDDFPGFETPLSSILSKRFDESLLIWTSFACTLSIFQLIICKFLLSAVSDVRRCQASWIGLCKLRRTGLSRRANCWNWKCYEKNQVIVISRYYCECWRKGNV